MSDEPDFPPPMPIAQAAIWLDKHNPYEEGTQDWYTWSIRFWIDQSEKERARSVWISRIALLLLTMGSLAEIGGLLIGLVVELP